MNYYNALKKTTELSQWEKGKITETELLAKTLKDGGQDSIIMYGYSEHENQEYYEGADVVIIHEKKALSVNFCFGNKFTLSELKRTKCEHVDNEERRKLHAKHIEPLNKVRTFNLKRFQVLASATVAMLAEIEALNTENEIKYNDSLNKIAGITGIRKANGYLDFGMYKYSWEVQNNGRISDKITMSTYGKEKTTLEIVEELLAQHKK